MRLIKNKTTAELLEMREMLYHGAIPSKSSKTENDTRREYALADAAIQIELGTRSEPVIEQIMQTLRSDPEMFEKHVAYVRKGPHGHLFADCEE